MKNSVAFAIIVLGIVGIVFGIQYLIENYNKPSENKPVIEEEKLEEILPTLTIPKLYDTYFENNVEALFYELENININDMSNSMKLSLVVNNLHDKEYGRDFENGTVKLNGNDVKEYYHKLYGNIEYKPESFVFFESTVCQRKYEYNVENDYYLIYLPSCGGRIGPAVWKEYIKEDKQIKENSIIYIDYYVASYRKVLEEDMEEQQSQGEEPIQIYNRIFENKIYMGKEFKESIVNDLIKQNLVSKYRLIYEKQSDGKYYFKSGEWIENTLL